MESSKAFRESVKNHIQVDSGYNRFIGVMISRFVNVELYDAFKSQVDYVCSLHKSVYFVRKYDIQSVQNFEETNCVSFLDDFDSLCAKSSSYTQQEFFNVMGRRLHTFIKEYNKLLRELSIIKENDDKKRADEQRRLIEEQKKRIEEQERQKREMKNLSTARPATNSGANISGGFSVRTQMINPVNSSKSVQNSNNNKTSDGRLPSIGSMSTEGQQVKTVKRNPQTPKIIPNNLKFKVNPPEKAFVKEAYMQGLEFDKTSIPKAFEKNLPVAVTLFPNRLLKEKLNKCIAAHRSFETFLDSEYDDIMRFENLVTSYYLNLVSGLVTIPQMIADSDGKFMEVDSNLMSATDDYLKAIIDLLDKFMKKVDMTTKTQMDTFKSIVDSIV